MGAFFLLSPAVSAIGNTFVKRYGGAFSSMRLNRNGVSIGAVLLWVAALTTERWQDQHFTAAAVASIVYLAVVGTVLTFGLYFWLLRSAPAYKLSLIAYVIPVVALTLGMTLGQEEILFHTLLGTAIILLGVSLASRPPRSPRDQPALATRGDS
jgi:drug/metabolite transporter (DMT)-like permease